MNRDKSIDFMKVILVIGMIEAHVIQFLGNLSNKLQSINSDFINLITFSGFMFCFGYVSNIVYFKKTNNNVKKRLFKNFIRILIGFYISGSAYILLVERQFSVLELVKMIFLFKIPGYSEFLITFAILNLAILVFLEQIKCILENKKLFIGIIIISLLTTFIPYQMVKFTQIGLIIGSNKFSCFPLIQYSSYFLIGAYFNKYKIKYNFKIMWIFGILEFLFIINSLINKKLPNRFPPEILWILGGMFFVYIYYLISIYLSEKIKIKSFYFIGENTLDFLIVSNIILFLIYNFYGKLYLGFGSIFIITLVVLLISYFIIYLKVILLNLRINKSYEKR